MKRAERTELRRREILAAYYQALLDEGLQGASIAKVARRLDVTPSLLLHYFGTKDQMTIALVDYLLDEFRHSFADQLAAIEDPVTRLRTILDALFSPGYHRLLDDRAFYACFYLSLQNDEVQKRFAVLDEATMQLVEGTIVACMDEGAIPRADARELATLVNVLEEGYAFRIGGDPDEAAKTALGEMLRGRAAALLGLDA
jgi:AcrR family transcriptional regulator